ncbi:Uncharacterized protein TCM_014947 [Theobroma cacao]|uniref:Uncharacterized protein n=1 Tax=Theobroma cacao TaxID=3641 RepID=A0A061FZE6_THECC|nr:Uncharacterized protein TCM_014947 [Theobroma cacao]
MHLCGALKTNERGFKASAAGFTRTHSAIWSDESPIVILVRHLQVGYMQRELEKLLPIVIKTIIMAV